MDTAISLARILALVMQSEADVLHNDDAAMAVGFVFMNRMDNGEFGAAPEEVIKGFHAAQLTNIDRVPRRYISLAERVLKEDDTTRGSLYIISWADAITIAKLAGYPEYAGFLRAAAPWQSKWRIINGNIYGLYAYRKYPVNVLQDMLKNVPTDKVLTP